MINIGFGVVAFFGLVPAGWLKYTILNLSEHSLECIFMSEALKLERIFILFQGPTGL